MVRCPQSNKQRNLDIPIFRYADVLLMYAETQNYLNNGPTQAAKNALQEVRNRAGVGEELTIPNEQEALMMLLYKSVNGNLLQNLHYAPT